MEGLLFILILFAFSLLTVAIYFFVSRDTDQYRRRVDERLKQLVQERGGASKREMQLLKEELLSSVPAFHRALIRFEIFTKLQAVLRQADLKITVYRFVIVSLVAGFVAGVIIFLVTGSLMGMLMTTAIVMVIPILVVFNKRNRRFRSFLEQLPDALELMVRSLQAGHSFSSAL